MASDIRKLHRSVRGTLCAGALLATMATVVTGCNKTESSTKTTTTKKTDTPEGTKVTTEKHEKTVETKPK